MHTNNYLTFGILIFLINSINGADFYRAAVVEYAPVIGDVVFNSENFLNLIIQAKNASAEIIVFPEIGLNGYGPCVEGMLTNVPHPRENITVHLAPKEANYTKAFRLISEAADTFNIYVVVNVAEVAPCAESKLCPQSGRLRYNTNVVFDRNGAVIARYRKFNLFGEVGTNVTADPELAIFDTDFGVRFATFICFDLMFDRPALQLVKQLGITDFVFSTAWFSELPFLTAVQAQHMWSYSLDVNFLASGYNNPSVGSGGSGIFLGREGPKIMEFPQNTTTRLLVANVPKKNVATQDFLTDKENRGVTDVAAPAKNVDSFEKSLRFRNRGMYLKRDNLTAYHSASLENVTETYHQCHGDFCCDFEITHERVENVTSFNHRAMVFDGVRTFDKFASGGVQVCALVMCENNTSTGCGVWGDSGIKIIHISIRGYFKNKGSLIMPSTLDRDLLPLSSNAFQFYTDCNALVCNVYMSSKQAQTNLQTFGIYSRNFDRDGDPVTVLDSSATSLFSSLTFLVILNVIFK